MFDLRMKNLLVFVPENEQVYNINVVIQFQMITNGRENTTLNRHTQLTYSAVCENQP